MVLEGGGGAARGEKEAADEESEKEVEFAEFHKMRNRDDYLGKWTRKKLSLNDDFFYAGVIEGHVAFGEFGTIGVAACLL